jgi:hypothetical protein
MMIVIRVLLHVAWIVPFFFGRPYLAVAMLLLVLLCYVKVFKFRQQLADLAERGGDSERKAVLLNALQRWQALTWLKNP